MEEKIIRSNNEIIISSNLYGKDSHFLFTMIYCAIEDKKYSEIVLDFSRCTFVPPTIMIVLCSYAQYYKQKGISFFLVEPIDEKICRLFVNSNWSFYIDPANFPQSSFSGYRQVPVIQYTNPKEQEVALRKILNSLLSSYPDFDRNAFAAIEWSINEVMDNVLTHSESPIGGLVQMTTYNNEKKKIEINIADAGLGIPKTLIDKYPGVNTDTKALMYSIKEGVTNGKGQGNGLFGSFNVCSESQGQFLIDSGSAVMYFNNRDGLHVVPNKIPLTGTLVSMIINCNTDNLLERSLRFNNRVYYPVDFIELKYEMHDNNVFFLAKETDSLGSRIAGTPVKNKLLNIFSMSSERFFIDFSEIVIASNSFLDEAIVKFIEDIGEDKFKERFTIINISQTIYNLLNKSYKQRLNKEIDLTTASTSYDETSVNIKNKDRDGRS